MTELLQTAKSDGSSRSGREQRPQGRLGVPDAMLQAELAQVETPGSEGKWVSLAHLPESRAQGANVRRENTEQNGSRMGGSFLQGSPMENRHRGGRQNSSESQRSFLREPFTPGART